MRHKKIIDSQYRPAVLVMSAPVRYSSELCTVPHIPAASPSARESSELGMFEFYGSRVWTRPTRRGDCSKQKKASALELIKRTDNLQQSLIRFYSYGLVNRRTNRILV